MPDYTQERISRIEVKGQKITLSFRQKELKDKLYQNGLNVQGIGMLRFTPEKNKTFRITVIGVPEVVADKELRELYAKFGEIVNCYSVKKFTLGGGWATSMGIV